MLVALDPMRHGAGLPPAAERSAEMHGDARAYSAIFIRKAIQRAGLSDCRIHTLRHTHTSRLVQNGMSVYEVKESLGHTDIKTTLRYAHLEQRQVSSKARDVINRLNKNSERLVLGQHQA